MPTTTVGTYDAPPAKIGNMVLVPLSPQAVDVVPQVEFEVEATKRHCFARERRSILTAVTHAFWGKCHANDDNG
jgi:hypothetical protein